VAGSSPPSNVLNQLIQGGMDQTKRLSDLFEQPPEQQRGDTGNVSLSDQVRSGQVPDADSGQQQTVDLGGNFGGESIGGAGADLGGQAVDLGGNFGGESIGGAEFGAELSADAAAGAGGGLALGVIGTIPSIWEGINDYMQTQSGISATKQNIKTGQRNVGTVLPQLAGGAIDPATLKGMSPKQLQEEFTRAINAYGGSNVLPAEFAMSGRTQMGLAYPDYTQAISTARKLEPVDFFNMVASQDALGAQGLTPGQEGATGGAYETGGIPFGEALHALAPYAGLQKFGPQDLTAVSPFDPYYGKQPIVTETGQAGPEGALPDVQRQARTPEEFLSTIGADPKLAAQLGPLMENVPPGQFLDRLTKVFSLVNPNFDQSEMGMLLSRLGGGGSSTAPTAAPAASPAAPSPFDVPPPAIAGGTPAELEKV
jgi:hypothetical protein